MFPEAKKMLKTLQVNYNASQDKEAFLIMLEKNRDQLAESPLILARNTPSQNHYQAFCIILRIYKNRKMEKEINHTERAHALLSASGASRWIACTPSPRLEESFENKSSSFAEEGTLAHEFAEINLRMLTDLITESEYREAIKPLLAHPLYGGTEMELYVEKLLRRTV